MLKFLVRVFLLSLERLILFPKKNNNITLFKSTVYSRLYHVPPTCTFYYMHTYIMHMCTFYQLSCVFSSFVYV